MYIPNPAMPAKTATVPGTSRAILTPCFARLAPTDVATVDATDRAALPAASLELMLAQTP